MGETPTVEQWDLICAVEEFWHENRHFPNNQIIAERTSLSLETVEELLSDENVRRRIERRGIDYNAVPGTQRGELKRNDSRLDDKMLAVAMALLNVSDTRTLAQKLRALGVSQTTYQGWTKNKKFSDFMQSQMDALFGDAMPLVHKALIDKAVAGDYKSIKLIYEMTGRYTGQNSQSQANFTMLVHKLIEIIQQYIHDPVVLQAIGDEMKQLVQSSQEPMQNGYVQVRPELTSGI